jgi:hypothetical protein
VRCVSIELAGVQLLVALTPVYARGSARARENELPFQLSVKGASGATYTPRHEDNPSEMLVKLFSEAVLD